MTQLSGGVIAVPTLAAYLLVALIVFAEGSVLVRHVIPGETAALFGGAATTGALDFHVSLPHMLAVVTAAAVAAGCVAYRMGGRQGATALGYRTLVLRRERLLSAQRFLVDHARAAIFLSRFTRFRREVLPALAGVTRMPFRRFLLWHALGAVGWSLLFVGLGGLAGDVIEDGAAVLANGFLVVVLTLVVADIAASRRRTRGSGGS
ncbi:DedA family protein [Streptomyces radicis]|uniref:DedA family protein n=1 Tax=Streptomyces radicis TaxID=1750517 RepID=A0A3A9WIM0_9ACTN|nr:VTT domain-containing protein [Streptomyces radicis]RKN12868.1 DedA family protein [Streptomyces radicis]RKN27367.1 DedA family protein [Streptomyces radicis]